MTAINTEAERARLDEPFALVEAETDHSAGAGEMPENAETPKPASPKEERAANRAVNANPKMVIGNIRQMISSGAKLTPRERYYMEAYKTLYENHVPAMKGELALARSELNRLSIFATSVINRLEKAERAAREQDNHHFYKIFADSVGKLAAKLQVVADVEN